MIAELALNTGEKAHEKRKGWSPAAGRQQKAVNVVLWLLPWTEKGIPMALDFALTSRTRIMLYSSALALDGPYSTGVYTFKFVRERDCLFVVLGEKKRKMRKHPGTPRLCLGSL